MEAVSWNPEILISRGDEMQSSVADVIAVAKRNRGMKIRMERSGLKQILGLPGCIPASKAQFREGCVKAVELGMQPLPERARVMAEIHRRIDRAMELDDGSVAWQSSLAPILDFAGAWALAARLMLAGLSVLVHEEDGSHACCADADKGRADVELVIPIVPACAQRG